MGKCSICKNRIEYNSFKEVDGVIYCLNCVPTPKPKRRRKSRKVESFNPFEDKN